MNPCWLPHYRLALSYARSFNRDHKYDIVHDTWLAHHKNYQEDLFDIDYQSYPSYLYRAIKWTFGHWKTKEFNHLKDAEPLNEEWLYRTDPMFGALVAQDYYNQIYARLYAATGPKSRDYKNRDKALDILKLTAAGYTQTDIAERLGYSRNLIHFYVNKIRSMSSLNPFNGSRLEVKKTITESQWDKRTDKDDYVESDVNEYYRLMEHKESKEGLLIRLRTPDRNPYIK